MYYCFVDACDDQINHEIKSVLNQFENVQIKHFHLKSGVVINKHFLNCLCILITEINPVILEKLNNLQCQAPDIPVVFYNHSLVVSNLKQIGDTSRLNMIVGENRKKILIELIQKINNNYWRKIPYQDFSIDVDSLSPRLKKALIFIENAEINKCNIDRIASMLNISPGYFSQEFKRETGQSFRSFMQKLLNYYEDLILKRVNIPTKFIAQLLGYSELSSFSRSFKNRKGISPRTYKKMSQNEIRALDGY